MVNEEVSAKMIRVVVDYTFRPSINELKKTLAKLAQKYKTQQKSNVHKEPKGKMAVKDLINQGKGAQKIELDGEDALLFNRLAKKYGVDYAIVKDKETGNYKVFFKAQDADAISDLVADYTRRTLGKEKGAKESILIKLKEKIASVSRSGLEMVKERSLGN